MEYRDSSGRIRGAQARVLDFDDPSNNDWLAVNQFTVVEDKAGRRLDVVLFVNGLPLGVVELKNPADPDATIWTAWQQLQTYKNDLPTLFAMNAVMVVSDGVEARLGTLTAGREWFKPWRTFTGEELADKRMLQLQVLLQGVCTPERFLELVHGFIVFEDDGSGQLDKKIAGYHQFHAVQAAVEETLRAAALQHATNRTGKPGDSPTGEPDDQHHNNRDRNLTGTPTSRHHNSRDRNLTGTPTSRHHNSRDRNLTGTPTSRHHNSRDRNLTGTPTSRHHNSRDRNPTGTPTSRHHNSRDRNLTGTPTSRHHNSRDRNPTGTPTSRHHSNPTRKPGGEPGDRRIGVVWHTQGSGKSLTMVFYAGRIIREPAMSNPTVVLLTDRNDLDDQLFATFSRCAELLRQPPVQARTRAHLRQLLDMASGGVVFTTIQKFPAR